MAEQAEIPEADSPFGKRVAVTIAIVAVVMAVIANRGDDAKTDALLKTTEAANKWSYFQAKSLKQHAFDIQAKVLMVNGSSAFGTSEAHRALSAQFDAQVKRYETEKIAIQAEAQHLESEARQAIAVNNRCDQATLFMQLAVVACSVAILAHLAIFWWGGMAVAVLGMAFGISSFWVQPNNTESAQAAAAAVNPAEGH
jgi:hypothetical protein